MERGSLSLPVVLAVAMGFGLAASLYLNYHQHEQSAQDRKLMQGQITDLKYQVTKDQQAAVDTTATVPPTPTPLATPEPSATPKPEVAGTSNISLSQLGVTLTTADPIADLTYDMTKNGIYPAAALSTRALISKYPACKPSKTNNALGQIVQKRQKTSSTGTLIKQLGTYYYFYIPPAGFCAADQGGRDALAAARAAVKNAALPTLAN